MHNPTNNHIIIFKIDYSCIICIIILTFTIIDNNNYLPNGRSVEGFVATDAAILLSIDQFTMVPTATGKKTYKVLVNKNV